jgi:hypothetical protein
MSRAKDTKSNASDLPKLAQNLRLAEALRENLKRRKAQSRGRLAKDTLDVPASGYGTAGPNGELSGTGQGEGAGPSRDQTEQFHRQGCQSN